MAKAKSVAAWFEMVEPDMAPITTALRDAIERANPGLSCKLAWGFPCWSGNERIFSIIAHKAHCNLQLWYGADLAAAHSKRIEGTGKRLRHVKIRRISEIDATLGQIITTAIMMDRAAPQKVH